MAAVNTWSITAFANLLDNCPIWLTDDQAILAQQNPCCIVVLHAACSSQLSCYPAVMIKGSADGIATRTWLWLHDTSICSHHGLSSKHSVVCATGEDIHGDVGCIQNQDYHEKLRYKVRPKFHQFHCEVICRLSTSRLNPKYAGCNLEEDFIGKVMACTKGAVHAATLSSRVLQRWLLQYNCWLAAG